MNSFPFILAVALGLIILVITMYTYMDYRRHLKPLIQVDASARETYTYFHHILSVTLPLLQYRIHNALHKAKSSGDTTIMPQQPK